MSLTATLPSVADLLSMGLDEFSPPVLFSSILGTALLSPALLLAALSWVVGSGALMEAIAVRSNAAESRAK